MITYHTARPAAVTDAAVLDLYAKVGWTAYLADPANTLAALTASTVLWATAGATLCGLVRAVTDHRTILYVQDLLVAPDWQRQGIGSALLSRLRAAEPRPGQVVLLADDTAVARQFYLAAGFTAAGQAAEVAFIVDARQ
ncbi:GNAT family N-acetyltransferase [Lacticaseibacillus suihuaensis]